jgi:hypothetical protein
MTGTHCCSTAHACAWSYLAGATATSVDSERCAPGSILGVLRQILDDGAAQPQQHVVVVAALQVAWRPRLQRLVQHRVGARQCQQPHFGDGRLRGGGVGEAAQLACCDMAWSVSAHGLGTNQNMWLQSHPGDGRPMRGRDADKAFCVIAIACMSADVCCLLCLP